MQYMLIPAHTCMRQSRSGGVFGGLWQTLYVSGNDETSPIGWDWAWDRVDNLTTSSDLAWYTIQPCGGTGSGTSEGGRRGEVSEIGLSEGTGMEEKSVCAHDLGCPDAMRRCAETGAETGEETGAVYAQDRLKIDSR